MRTKNEHTGLTRHRPQARIHIHPIKWVASKAHLIPFLGCTAVAGLTFSFEMAAAC